MVAGRPLHTKRARIETVTARRCRRRSKVARFTRSGRGLKRTLFMRARESTAVARFTRSGRGLKPEFVVAKKARRRRPLHTKRARIETSSLAGHPYPSRVARFTRSGRGLKHSPSKGRDGVIGRPLHTKRARIETRAGTRALGQGRVARFTRSGRGLKPLHNSEHMEQHQSPASHEAGAD